MTADFYARRAYDQSQQNSREIKQLEEFQRANNKVLTAAFNRMTLAIEALTVEVRQLRQDINPQTLDKPKLPAPDGGT